MHRDAKYEDLVSSAGVVLATTVVERTSGLPVAGVGEHGTRGAARIVDRGRGKAWGGGVRRIHIGFSRSRVFFGLLFYSSGDRRSEYELGAIFWATIVMGTAEILPHQPVSEYSLYLVLVKQKIVEERTGAPQYTISRWVVHDTPLRDLAGTTARQTAA